MKVLLRPWSDEDALALYHMSIHPYYIKKRIWKYLYPDSFPHALATIHFYQRADPTRFFYRAIVCEHHVCGYIQCEKKTSQSAELTYWLDVSYWHRGIMKQAIQSCCHEVFKSFAVVQLYARVEQKNMDSQQVLEANGFHRECIEDMVIYRKYR